MGRAADKNNKVNVCILTGMDILILVGGSDVPRLATEDHKKVHALSILIFYIVLIISIERSLTSLNVPKCFQ